MAPALWICYCPGAYGTAHCPAEPIRGHSVGWGGACGCGHLQLESTDQSPAHQPGFGFLRVPVYRDQHHYHLTCVCVCVWDVDAHFKNKDSPPMVNQSFFFHLEQNAQPRCKRKLKAWLKSLSFLHVNNTFIWRLNELQQQTGQTEQTFILKYIYIFTECHQWVN